MKGLLQFLSKPDLRLHQLVQGKAKRQLQCYSAHNCTSNNDFVIESSSPCLAATALQNSLSEKLLITEKQDFTVSELLTGQSFVIVLLLSQVGDLQYIYEVSWKTNYPIKAPSRSSIPLLYSLLYKWRSEGLGSINKFLLSKEFSKCAPAVEKHNRIFVLPPLRINTVTPSKILSTMVLFCQFRRKKKTLKCTFKDHYSKLWKRFIK